MQRKVSGTEKRLSCINVPEIGSRHVLRLQGSNPLGPHGPVLPWPADPACPAGHRVAIALVTVNLKPAQRWT